MTGSSIMAAFAGEELPGEVAERLRSEPVAGFTLFRHHNVRSAAQVRVLTDALQAATGPAGPLLIATDQEGGQLIALGDDTTDFAGAMAVGAAGDEELAERVARATGRELRALGVNVDYAPVCDLATNSANPALGLRSFGDDPQAVARLIAATVRGLRAAGVAATAKHFPGAGDVALDPHFALGAIRLSSEALQARELVPFRAAIEAGADLVMSGHFAVPEVTGDAQLPATLARAVITDLLRADLGFEGLAITDALDMRALGQGPAEIVEVLCALRAGADLLLGTPDSASPPQIEAGVRQAVLRGLVDRSSMERSAERLGRLRTWLSGFEQPDLDVVGCAEHRALARELAERSVTLVRDDARLLPLRVSAEQRILVVMPRPADLTLADTSSYVSPTLGAATRRRHARTDELLVSQQPSESEVADVTARAGDCDMLVVGSISSAVQPAQTTLVQRLLALGLPTVTVALRTPWDLVAYPESQAHACSYGILPPTVEATVAALFGEVPFRGRLPVALDDLYPRGHGLTA